MKKPVVFLGASFLSKKTVISTGDVPDLQFEVADFKNLRPQNELPCFTRSCDVNVSIDIDIEKTKDGGFLTDLSSASPVFAVKVQDRRGNELIIPNAKISERLRVTQKIVKKEVRCCLLGASPSEHRNRSYYKFTKLIFYIL